MKHSITIGICRALVGVSLFTSSGCSLLFVKPPEPSGKIQTGERKKCTTSRAMPVLDTILTGLEVARTGLAVNADDSVYEDPEQPLSREADIALGIGFTALFLGSAVYGYSATARCERGPSPETAQDPVENEPPERWSGPDPSPSVARPQTAVRPPTQATPVASVGATSSVEASGATPADGGASAAESSAPVGDHAHLPESAAEPSAAPAP